MIARKRLQRSYDHRLRQFVCTTGDTAHALRIGVPRSTANGWLQPRAQPVISLSQFGQHVEALETEVARLRVQITMLRHLLRLLFLILKMSGFSLQNCRIPNSSDKSKLIKRIHDAAKAIPRGRVLNVIGLSSSRFYAWKSIEACELADNSSCPKSFPTQMSVAEVDTMRSLITSADYRHLSTGALARVARKVGKVFAAPATWYRLVNRHNWRRPRLRSGVENINASMNELIESGTIKPTSRTTHSKDRHRTKCTSRQEQMFPSNCDSKRSMPENCVAKPAMV